MPEARGKEDWKKYWAVLTEIKMDAVVEHLERRSDSLRIPAVVSGVPGPQHR
jgi:hypothetical protein